MIKSAFYLAPDGNLEHSMTPERIKDLCISCEEGLLWVDIEDPTEEDGQLLSEVFRFHPLAVADCLSSDISPPKINDFDDYLFFIVHGVNYHNESDVLETTELDIFLGNHFVVTWHWAPLYSVNSIKSVIEQDTRPMKRGADFLAHAIMNALIDHIVPVIDQMIEHAEDIEEETITSPQRSTLDAILKLKQSIRRLNRVVTPQREVANRLSRGEFPLIRPEAQIFYRDTYDEIFRIEALAQSLRDRASDAMSIYLSSVANRQNETMKIFTIVAVIFLPLTLLAGIYGMNFENMPELKWRWGYFAVLGIIGTTISGMLWFFWARNWILVGRRRVSRFSPMKIGPHLVKNRMDKSSLLTNLDSVITLPRRSNKERSPENNQNGQE